MSAGNLSFIYNLNIVPNTLNDLANVTILLVSTYIPNHWLLPRVRQRLALELAALSQLPIDEATIIMFLLLIIFFLLLLTIFLLLSPYLSSIFTYILKTATGVFQAFASFTRRCFDGIWAVVTKILESGKRYGSQCWSTCKNLVQTIFDHHRHVILLLFALGLINACLPIFDISSYQSAVHAAGKEIAGFIALYVISMLLEIIVEDGWTEVLIFSVSWTFVAMTIQSTATWGPIAGFAIVHHIATSLFSRTIALVTNCKNVTTIATEYPLLVPATVCLCLILTLCFILVLKFIYPGQSIGSILAHARNRTTQYISAIYEAFTAWVESLQSHAQAEQDESMYRFIVSCIWLHLAHRFGVSPAMVLPLLGLMGYPNLYVWMGVPPPARSPFRWS